MSVITKWTLANSMKFNANAFGSEEKNWVECSSTMKILPQFSNTVTKRQRLNLKGGNTADVTAVDETFSFEMDILPKGEDAGADVVLEMVGKKGDEAKREYQFTNPFTNEVEEGIFAFDLNFGEADNIGTITGTLHVDGIPTISKVEG